jgi:uncharacterized protein YndB with AHSA1/START domain
MAAVAQPNEIKLYRIYDAPVNMVWDAWTDPAQAAHWWGPRGFSLTTHSKDLRPGGSWIYTMHGPDGTDYPNSTKYFEVEPHAKLVYDHGSNGDSPPMFRVTVLFSEVDGKTHMDMTMTLPSAEAAVETRKFIKTAGGDATWDRLAEYLEKDVSGKQKFFINRSFDVSIEQMFDMWTQPEHFSRWLPPTGFEMQFIKCDIKPGGSSFYVMSGPNGMKMYGRADYLHLDKPNRVVYTQQFCDEHEKVTRHPMSPTWPETMLTTVLLSAESDHRTRLTISWEPHHANAVEVDTFVAAKSGMTQGWTGSLDKLEEYLSDKA